MKLEDQVCSLELAKKLKELGVEQESYFQWYRERIGGSYNCGQYSILETADTEPWFAAYTVAELGEKLPVMYMTYRDFGKSYEVENWYASGLSKERYPIHHHSYATSSTEVNARAKMLIHLVENKIIILPTRSEGGV